ncbi:peptidoglycan D,D-transpeptidase FtsI family protein [Microlunatus speluncae]|uniref:peptidoglycan D,D-transpeptidase FtsI family protein n=1 Tax=Microlunatus speluncae TaxID=2594267 RepID=UPI0012667628|nr:penicillin-binding protein 2 [Microlunatus speluncae]
MAADERRPRARRTTSAPASTGTRKLRPGAERKQRAVAARTAARPAKKKVRHPIRRVALGNSPRRLRIVLVAMAIALSLCAGRLLQLQGFDSAAYAAGADQFTAKLPLLPTRGDLVDRNGSVLATTQPAVAVTADPTLTSNTAKNPTRAAQFAEVILNHLELDRATLLSRLNKPDTRFVYLAKKVPATTYLALAAELTEKKLYGVFRESDPIRVYPAGSVAAGVVGFVNGAGEGVAGLERSLDKQLAGVEGQEIFEMAPNGSRIPLGESKINPAVDGTDYQLTIDAELQWTVERRLAQQVQKVGGDTGTAITMNVKTGEILALANYPNYDASKPGDAAPEDRGNRAVSAAYEPGSVEKLLTAAALIEAGIADPETKLTIPERLESGGGLIKDAFAHGEIDLLMRGVIAKSSNIGTIMLARQMDKAKLRDYLALFGLGKKTGIEIAGEAAGHLPPADMKDYTRDQIAFGQGLSVTAVQEAAAIAALINGGVYHQPTVIKGATDQTGQPVPLTKAPPRRVISPETSDQMRDLMQAVVDHGSGKLAVDHYQSGGKTGTAQRYDPACGCYNGYTVSYVSAAPINDPELITYVVVDNPKSSDTGTSGAAPAATDIMQLALPRYGVPPTAERAKEEKITW